MTDAVEARMIAAAEELNRLVATCHERVACPKCEAPIGERCRRATRWGWRVTQHGDPLKHSHAERLRAAGIALR